ncbi:hypothetical protein D1007_41981 [Hordeum vulgare]|nr:hypothetical protein D1007_41981 [Hordeum vulgare]
MEAAIGAANGLIGTVLSHLSSEFLEAYVASSQLGLNSKKIKEDLMFTQGLLHEAQRRGMGDNPGLQGLLQNLTIKADEAEDALDELHYFIIQDHLDGTHYAVPDLGDNIRGHAQHGRHALRHTIGNCIACFSFSRMKDGDGGAATDAITNSPHNSVRNSRSGGNDGPVDKLSFDRVAMSKKIKSVIEEIQSLCDRVSKLLQLIPHHSTTTIITPRQRVTGSIIVQDTLHGRRALLDKTIDDILNIAIENNETLSVLPIVGPGGIGKTTFTHHLYNDKRIEEHFDVRAWVCVSTDFDVVKLSQQILSSIQRNTNSNQTSNLAELQVSITKELKSKRKGEAKGSMVLVTTRFPSKAEIVKTTDSIALQGLEFDEFFTFFKSLISGGNKPEYCQEDLDDLAIDIAKKLKGSPLAARTVGKKCLLELKQFCVKKESVGFELGELGELTELGGKLSIHNLEKVATKEEATEAKLVYKRYLKELRLVWGTDHQHTTESDVLDGLQPHHKLGALSIINHGGTRGPRWLWGDNSLKNLGSLHLEGVFWGTLPPFAQLLHLTSLTLINISVLREIRSGLFGVREKSFGHLKRVVLAVLVAPICSLLAATLKSLDAMNDERAESFTGEEDRALQLLTSLRSVGFVDCPNLSSLPQGLYNLPSLWDLRIVRSPQIPSLPKGPFPTSLKRVCLVAATLYMLEFWNGDRVASFTEYEEKTLSMHIGVDYWIMQFVLPPTVDYILILCGFDIW